MLGDDEDDDDVGEVAMQRIVKDNGMRGRHVIVLETRLEQVVLYEEQVVEEVAHMFHNRKENAALDGHACFLMAIVISSLNDAYAKLVELVVDVNVLVLQGSMVLVVAAPAAVLVVPHAIPPMVTADVRLDDTVHVVNEHTQEIQDGISITV